MAVPQQALSSGSNATRVLGLRGEYFDNNRLDGAPRIVRTDPQVDFRWTLNSPGRGIPFDAPVTLYDLHAQYRAGAIQLRAL